MAGAERRGGALFALRRWLGGVFRWDDERHDAAGASYVNRLTEADRLQSQVQPGSRAGRFRVLYVLPDEALSETRNATVHAFLALALTHREPGYVLYAAFYVTAVSRFTSLYMALIDPFRRFLVYPALGRQIQQAWIARSNMNVTKSGSQPSGKGPSEYFTGNVRVDSPFQRAAPARVSGAIVTFEPGARTAWHTHPLGQTLIVTSGLGRVQRVGGAIEGIAPGDVVWIEPGEKHWHGASPTTAMTHVAIAEMLDGKAVQWMEHVTDEQYG